MKEKEEEQKRVKKDEVKEWTKNKTSNETMMK
jgi:hypothetical protein